MRKRPLGQGGLEVSAPTTGDEKHIGAATVVLSTGDLRNIELSLATIHVEGDRYPPHLQQRVGR